MQFGQFSCLNSSGRLVFEDPSTGVIFSDGNFINLLSKIRTYRLEEGGDLSPGWQARVGDAYCKQNPNLKACKGQRKERVFGYTSMSDLVLFFHVVRKWLKEGGKLVSKEEANRRAEICSDCPMNVKLEGCAPCFKLLDKIRSSVGSMKLDHDYSLRGCGACGCSLEVKVWCPPEVVAGTVKEENLPKHCWMRGMGDLTLTD